LLQAWSTNQQAALAVRECLPTDGAASETTVSLDKAWLRAIVAHCSGDTVAAQAAIQEALAASPRYVTLAHSLAPEDVTIAEFAAAQYPTDSEARFWSGDLLVEQGDVDKAMVAYEQGLTVDGRNGLIWVRLGRLYEDKGDWESAVNAYDQGCRHIDQGKNGCPAAGRLYMAHNQYELAAERYRESISQLPGWLPAKRGLVEALLALGRTDEALPYLRELAASGDEDARQKLDTLEINP
jgi:tetratricopeptide (TPR) repeat protein